MQRNGTGSTLRVGLVGAGRRGRMRAEVLGRHPAVTLVGVSDADGKRAQALAEACGAQPYVSASALLRDADLVCLAVPPAERPLIARTAVGEGTHVFTEWPPASGPEEAERLSRLAEEAGVEVGVAYPLPIAALLRAAPLDWRPRLLDVALDTSTDDAVGDLPWSHRLAGVLALCVGFARGGEVQRLEAEADRDGVRFRAVALGLRFRGGLYAQATVRERARPLEPQEQFRLDASGQGVTLRARALRGPVCVEHDGPNPNPNPNPPLALAPGAIETPADEAVAFAAAVAAGHHAPVSLFDALHTLRLTERLMDRLR